MNAELTHIRKREIEREIRELADEASIRVQILTPMQDAQALASKMWRNAVDLRSALRAADAPGELLIMTDILIDGSMKQLSDIERFMYPGEEFEMTPTETPVGH